MKLLLSLAWMALRLVGAAGLLCLRGVVGVLAACSSVEAGRAEKQRRPLQPGELRDYWCLPGDR